jgi:transcriptional regulator with XRE-family HTH domain
MTKRSAAAPDWDAVARYIREGRVALGLSKTDAALAASVSLTTYRGLEAGTNPMPTSQTLVRIANALKIDAKVLFRLAGRQGEVVDARPATPVAVGRAHRALASLLAADPHLDQRDRDLLVLIYDFLAVR